MGQDSADVQIAEAMAAERESLSRACRADAVRGIVATARYLPEPAAQP